ncbi:MAG: hypothetical protein WD271_04715 [Acidimicrobiia bacterium]
MSALVLDAGALVAVDRGDRAITRRLRVAQIHGLELRTHPLVVAQVWRDASGRQANVGWLLKAVDVVPIDDQLGRACGVLLSVAGTGGAIDAAVVLVARDGDEIITSDPDDVGHLVTAAGLSVRVVTA